MAVTKTSRHHNVYKMQPKERHLPTNSQLLELRLLGSPQVHLSGLPLTGFRSRKALALLFFLSVVRRHQSRQKMALMFWGDRSESSARASLRSALSNLRQLCGDFLVITKADVSVNADYQYWLDVNVVDSCTHESALHDQNDIVDLYRGAFLEGFTVDGAAEFESWVETQRNRLQSQVLDFLSNASSTAIEKGKLNNALMLCRHGLTIQPWCEEFHYKIIQLHAKHGRRGAALTQFKVCKQILEDELSVNPAPRTIQLVDAIDKEYSDFNISTHKHSKKLTTPTETSGRYIDSTFIGRRREVREIMNRIASNDCRLLLITGPGGIGKTRTAKHIAGIVAHTNKIHNLSDKNVYFVSLIDVESKTSLIVAIADAIGCSLLDNESPTYQLVHYLESRNVLLILDNFEQLASDANWLTSILDKCRSLKVIVTSRHSLDLQDAWHYPIGGLGLPDRGDSTPNNITTHSRPDAVELFFQIATRLRPNFSLHDEYANIVAISQLTGGNPLALELAGSWLTVLDLEQIRTRIENGLDILGKRGAKRKSRHGSIARVLDQSWDLLSDDLRDTLQQLSVFRGGFRLDAANQIHGVNVDKLAILVDRSLLQFSGQRYEMHPLLLQYVGKRMKSNQEAYRDALYRHVAYFFDLVEGYARFSQESSRRISLDLLIDESTNIATAWTYAMEYPRPFSSRYFSRVIDGIFDFYTIIGHYQNGLDLFVKALDAVSSKKLSLSKIDVQKLTSRVWVFRARLGSQTEARDHLEPLTEDPYFASTPNESAIVHSMLGEITAWQGEPLSARKYLRRSILDSRKSSNQWRLATSLERLAQIELHFGQFHFARTLANESLSIFRRLDQSQSIGQVIDTLAFSSFSLGDYDDAERHYRECLAIFENTENDVGIALSLGGLGYVACANGNATEAISLIQRAVFHARRSGDRIILCTRLGCLGFVAYESDNREIALQAINEAVTLADDMQSQVFLPLILSVSSAMHFDPTRTAQSWRLCRQALCFAGRIGEPTINAIVALVRYAELSLECASLPAADAECARAAKRRAYELLVFVRRSKACWQITRSRANRLLADFDFASYPQHSDGELLVDGNSTFLNWINTCLTTTTMLPGDTEPRNLSANQLVSAIPSHIILGPS